MIGAGTQPSRDPDAPVGNGRAIAVRAAAGGRVRDLRRSRRGRGRGNVAPDHRGRWKSRRGRGRRHDRGRLPPGGLRRARAFARRSGPERGHRFRHGRGGHVHRRLGQDVRPQPARPLHAGAPRLGDPVRQRGDRVRGVGGGPPARQPHSRLRRIEGGSHRTQPSRGGRRCPSRHPGQRARARPDRHPARARRAPPGVRRVPDHPCRWAGRARGGRWPLSPCSSSRTRRATSPARFWPSTGG